MCPTWVPSWARSARAWVVLAACPGVGQGGAGEGTSRDPAVSLSGQEGPQRTPGPLLLRAGSPRVQASPPSELEHGALSAAGRMPAWPGDTRTPWLIPRPRPGQRSPGEDGPPALGGGGRRVSPVARQPGARLSRGAERTLVAVHVPAVPQASLHPLTTPHRPEGPSPRSSAWSRASFQRQQGALRVNGAVRQVLRSHAPTSLRRQDKAGHVRGGGGGTASSRDGGRGCLRRGQVGRDAPGGQVRGQPTTGTGEGTSQMRTGEQVPWDR